MQTTFLMKFMFEPFLFPDWLEKDLPELLYGATPKQLHNCQPEQAIILEWVEVTEEAQIKDWRASNKAYIDMGNSGFYAAKSGFNIL